MSRHRLLALLALLLLTAIVTGSRTFAQGGGQYALTWFSVSSGGGSAVGGTYGLSGTVGQAVAASPSSGGSYTLTGGFMAGIAAPEVDQPQLYLPLLRR